MALVDEIVKVIGWIPAPDVPASLGVCGEEESVGRSRVGQWKKSVTKRKGSERNKEEKKEQKREVAKSMRQGIIRQGGPSWSKLDTSSEAVINFC